ncbi:MAG TPA: hypothetical protein VNI61_00280 [Gemmatimonadales bacterium]|nr:hypothetical protein [Gemmatimonadales bacterium]
MAAVLDLERRARRAGTAAALVALAAGVPTLNRILVGVFYDDGLYAGLALALAQGDGYVHPHLPGTPAGVHYPPLYPLVLAPFFGSLPLAQAALAAKVANLLLAALAAGLVAWHVTRARLVEDGAPWWLGAAAATAGAVAIPLLTTQAVLFAEPLFAVLLATAVAQADHGRPWRAGVAAALALLTRSIAVAAGAGIVLYLLILRRAGWRPALRAGMPVAIGAALWGSWVLLHRSGIDPALALNYGTYGDALAQAGVSALGRSVPELLRPLGAITLGWLPGAAPYLVLGALGLGVLGTGMVVLARRSSAGLTLIGYFLILAVWPYPPDRFLWVVLPWIAVAWAAGAAALWRRRPLRLPVALVTGAILLGYGLYEVRGFRGRWWAGAARAISTNFEELVPALRILPEEAVLATDDEALVWLYTRRRAVPLYLYSYRGSQTVEPTPAAHRAYLERQGVTHVVLASPASPSARQLRALIGAYPGWLVPVRGWPGGRWLYAVRRAP